VARKADRDSADPADSAQATAQTQRPPRRP
jgi:hypothetical protein